ncbi:hypothetical protein [Aeropyrum camini]|uniref:Energy-coupling factor transporter transmembrane protein EcfT n=1 Tax=Aeropyrum camini SY1 = JCM 12091 TaxID=1198449 RepID=U3TBQ7_9CREN|nr:hypothetical protein [Aeropyrum camini]BAN90972.1 hypothetical protein ACAM_1503 [Aeropyrum camini SY1 = JCM 12091]
MSPRLHPLTAMASILAVFTLLYLDKPITATLLGAALAVAGGVFTRAPGLVLWLAVPTLAVVWVFHGLEAAVDTSLRVLSVALASSGSLSMVGLHEFRRFLEALGLSPRLAILPVLIARQADASISQVLEALDALRGRGLRGWRAVAGLAIPLLASAFSSSAILAEAIAAKVPGERRGPRGLRAVGRPGVWDAAAAAFTLALLLAGVLLGLP